MIETWARTTFFYMHNTPNTPRQHCGLVPGVATFETSESTLACNVKMTNYTSCMLNIAHRSSFCYHVASRRTMAVVDPRAFEAVIGRIYLRPLFLVEMVSEHYVLEAPCTYDRNQWEDTTNSNCLFIYCVSRRWNGSLPFKFALGCVLNPSFRTTFRTSDTTQDTGFLRPGNFA